MSDKGTLGDLVAGLKRNRSALEATLERIIPAPLKWERTTPMGDCRSTDGRFTIGRHGTYFRVYRQAAPNEWIALDGPGHRTLASAKAAAEAAR